MLTGFIYPTVSHWVWSMNPWLLNEGFADFAGSGVVHMVGGFAGLAGAIVVGPRKGRFTTEFDKNGAVITHEPHNKLLAALGTSILWVGWYGFNCGSTLFINHPVNENGDLYGIGEGYDEYAPGEGYDYGYQAARVAVTTTIAAAAGAITVFVVRLAPSKGEKYDLMGSLNGVLAGLVSITASCKVTTVEGAFAVGVVGGFVYMGSSWLLVKLKIDDPIDACPVHGFCGMWGVLSVGVAGVERYVGCDGCITSGVQFGMQFVGMLFILLWTLVLSFIMFFTIHKTCGMRVSEEAEALGLDVSEHGGSAYGKVDLEAEMTNVQKDNKVLDEAQAQTN